MFPNIRAAVNAMMLSALLSALGVFIITAAVFVIAMGYVATQALGYLVRLVAGAL